MGAGFVVLVIYLSLTRHPIDAPVFWDFKTGHILAYCWLMFWYLQIYRTTKDRVWIAAALCLMGIALEYVQGATGYRHFGYSDMRDNAIGIALGFMFAFTPLRDALAGAESTFFGT